MTSKLVDNAVFRSKANIMAKTRVKFSMFKGNLNDDNLTEED